MLCTTYQMDAFAQRKAATLQELLLDAGDFSRAGHVDQRAKAIVGLVNRHKDFYTTSSCSGRVSLFADPTTSTKAGGLKGGEWVYVSHEPAEAGAIVAAVREKLGEDPEDEDECEKKANETSQGIDPECSLVLRFEPFILSVEASSVEHGGRFVAAARDAGFRESGITGNDRRVVCSIRCSIRMETHVVSRGVRLVSDLAIRELVRIANEKWNANKLRAERLEETIARVFGREMDPGTSVGVSGTYDSPKLVHDVSPSDEQSHHVANSVSARHQWVFTVDPLRAKRCKDCLKNMNWLDKKRKAGIGAEGKVLLPITLEGAQILRDAVTSWESDVDPESPYVCVVQALQHGVAAVAESATGGDGETPVLAARIEFKNPAALIRQAALSIAVAAPTGKGNNVFGNEIPTKWEKLGSLALLPSDAFRSETLWPSATRAKLYGAVSLALGVTRLARQAEVSQGPKRESRAEMLWDPANAGGWVDTKELGVWYGLDVTKVMFSSGNGTEKQRMGKIAAAGETVVDLFAGIGYYTLQLLHHSGVAKVVACEWNPHSVEALRKNLVKNGFDETRCEVREGDNRRVAPTGVADRVLLGLLPDSERAWPTAVAALRDSGGVLHVHGNCASGEESVWVKRLEEEVSAAAASLGREWSVRVEHVERVKWYAPRVRHLVADVRCVPARLTSAWAHAVGASTSTSPGSTPTATGGGGARVSSYEHNLAQSQSPGPRSAHKPPSGFNVLTPGVVKTRISVFESPDHSEPNSPSANVSFRDISARTRRDGLNRATEKEKSVRRMHRPSRESFALGPLNQREPCVLTGLDVGSAPWTWSPSHLLAKPAVADHEISVHVSQSPHLDFVRKNFTFENVKFGDLLRKLEGEKDGKKTWYYLRSIGRNPRKEPAHALTQFPDLAKELSIPGDVLWGAAPGEVTGTALVLSQIPILFAHTRPDEGTITSAHTRLTLCFIGIRWNG